VQGSTIGVGPALRKARQARGVSVDEASRDTKIRVDFLRALEDEDFDRLLGDVYVRGALRSYSAYLGLPAERVVSAYARHASGPIPSPAPPPLLPDPGIATKRRRDNHRLWVMIAAVVLVVAGAFGVLSTRESAPTPAQLPSAPAPLSVSSGRDITLAVTARQQPVDVTVKVDDGDPQTFTLRPDESRSFEASTTLKVRIDPGGSASVVVSGKDLGFPGNAAHPWRKTFSFEQPDGATQPTP
jgi:cytoskeletal protein RodZ